MLTSIDTVQLVANNVGNKVNSISTGQGKSVLGQGLGQGTGQGTVVGVGGDFSQWSAATNQMCSMHGLGK